MNILFVAPYIYSEQYPEFTKNKTGFGFMVNDIFESICKSGENAFLVTNVITKGRKKTILRHTWKDVICNIKVKDCIQGIKWAIRFQQPIKARLKYIYYCINKGYFRKCVQKLNPDVIHIHGIGYGTLPYIQVCEELKAKYIITLHGLIGLDSSVAAPLWDKELEKQFLIYAKEHNRQVTVISTGIKKRIEKYYFGEKSDNIRVILNGTNIPGEIIKKREIRTELNLKSDDKLCIVLGSVCENKNQVQIVDAFSLLPDKIKEKSYLLICGEDYTNGLIKERIIKRGLEDRVFCLGFVCREELMIILGQTDLNIVASKVEGFGLPIIEATIQGVPTVTFEDLDAIEDLYNPIYMIKTCGRDTIKLAEAIQKALVKNWDKELIKNVGKIFSIDEICKKYCEEYEKIYL